MTNSLGIDLEKELGLDELPLETQSKVYQKAGESIITGVMARIIPTLEEDKKDELDKILSRDDSDEHIEKFMTENVPNFQEILTEEVNDFKKEGLAFFKQLG